MDDNTVAATYPYLPVLDIKRTVATVTPDDHSGAKPVRKPVFSDGWFKNAAGAAAVPSFPLRGSIEDSNNAVLITIPVCVGVIAFTAVVMGVGIAYRQANRS